MEEQNAQERLIKFWKNKNNQEPWPTKEKDRLHQTTEMKAVWLLICGRTGQWYKTKHSETDSCVCLWRFNDKDDNVNQQGKD